MQVVQLTTQPDLYRQPAYGCVEKVCREELAEISGAVVIALEALRARAFGQYRRSDRLLQQAARFLPTKPDREYWQDCRKELRALRAALPVDLSSPVDLAHHGDTSTQVAARTHARIVDIIGRTTEPHPLVLEWLIARAADAKMLGALKAKGDLRAHLISWGIDPTNQWSVMKLDHQRRRRLPDLFRTNGIWVYVGSLWARQGIYIEAETDRTLVELTLPGWPLTCGEKQVLERARFTDAEDLWSALRPQLYTVLTSWLDYLSERTR